jgi:hypothetical protein
MWRWSTPSQRPSRACKTHGLILSLLKSGSVLVLEKLSLLRLIRKLAGRSASCKIGTVSPLDIQVNILFSSPLRLEPPARART